MPLDTSPLPDDNASPATSDDIEARLKAVQADTTRGWTAERVALLRVLWLEPSLSSKDIAVLLGGDLRPEGVRTKVQRLADLPQRRVGHKGASRYAALPTATDAIDIDFNEAPPVRRHTLFDLTDGTAPRAQTEGVVKRNTYQVHKQRGVPAVEQLPAALAAAHNWLDAVGTSDPNGDPDQNFVRAAADKYGVTPEQALGFIKQSLDYYLPELGEPLPDMSALPPPPADISALFQPDAETRAAAHNAAKNIRPTDQRRSMFVPVTQHGVKRQRHGGGAATRYDDKVTRIDDDHIAKLESILADPATLEEMRIRFSNRRPGALASYIADTMRVLKPGYSSTKYGWVLTKPPYSGWNFLYATLEERAESCPVTCHAWDACYGASSGMTRRYMPDDNYMLAFQLEMQIVARLTKAVVRIMDLGDIPSPRFAKMLVQTVTAPEVKNNIALWVVTAKHPAAFPEAWLDPYGNLTDALRDDYQATGNIMLAAAFRHPRQIRLMRSTPFRNIPGTMAYVGHEDVPAQTRIPAGDSSRVIAKVCAMHHPAMEVDVRELGRRDAIEPDTMRQLRANMNTMCTTCAHCFTTGPGPLTGHAINLREHGAKVQAVINSNALRISTSRGRTDGQINVHPETGVVSEPARLGSKPKRLNFGD